MVQVRCFFGFKQEKAGLEIVSSEFCALVHVRELACFKPWCRWVRWLVLVLRLGAGEVAVLDLVLR